ARRRRRDRPRAPVPERDVGIPGALDRVRDPDPRGDPARRADDAHRADRQGRADGRLMALYERLRDLELVVEEVRSERRSVEVSSEFTRVTTLVVLAGRGQEGRGEDVTYTAEDHDWFPSLDPPGAVSLGAFSASLDGECGRVLRGQEKRLSFDAPIHSVADVRALPVEPGWMNIKPSRFGTVERLLECIEHCDESAIRLYGGGQFELDVGRRQIQ